MVRFFLMLCTGVLTSLFFFPFEFKALPGLNTKMAMAAMGLVVLAVRLAKGNKAQFSRPIIGLSFSAMMISFIGFVSVLFNNTQDYSYASYFMSMWVWLSAAYVVTVAIKSVHGRLSIPIVANYLIAVCLVQCVLALLIDNYPVMKHYVDAYIEQGQDFLNQANVRRLYGIGASLDVAGSRFAAVLILLAYLLRQDSQGPYISYYLAAFFFLAVVGNMIARTTTVGLVLAAVYWIYTFFDNKNYAPENNIKLWRWFICVVIIAVPLTLYLDQNSPFFHRQIRFAFEGFFSLFEEGEWVVASNEKLERMVVFPDNLKTWIIGDGYFNNPHYSDPYYVGETTKYGYYMGTDVGYLRFIFYFGMLGLLAFSSFMIYAARICVHRFPADRILFLFFLLAGFVVWMKVSTDLFLIFALFINVALLREEDELYNERIREIA